MFTSSLDFLYFSLAVFIILIGILLAVAIVYLIFILRDVSKTTYFLRDTMKQVNDFLYTPLMVANSVIEKIGPIIEAAQKRGMEILESQEKSKSKKRGRPKKKK
jgi:sensor histidine kinase YesM